MRHNPRLIRPIIGTIGAGQHAIQVPTVQGNPGSVAGTNPD